MLEFPKIVSLSRKGFDSGYGKMPSPILPDGTLLSMPIPSDEDIENCYQDLSYNGKSYYEIISELNPNTNILSQSHCHLDPDIRHDVKERDSDWLPCFGQKSAAQTVLRKSGISRDDLFLFFGWFKQTELFNGKLRFEKRAPDLHIIFGYLQIGDICINQNCIPHWLLSHPHAKPSHWNKGNTMYIARKNLTFIPNMAGAGTLMYSPKRVLTMNGKTRTIWNLPDAFRYTNITYHPHPWYGDEFHSAAKGQEFVFQLTEEISNWLINILKT